MKIKSNTYFKKLASFLAICLFIGQSLSAQVHFLGNLKEDNSFPSSEIQEIEKVGDTIYFVARDYEHGYELWLTDGTSEGTKMVKDLDDRDNKSTSNTYPISNLPEELTAYKNKLYFTLNNKMYVSDGTEEGTYLFPQTEKVYSMAVSGDKLFFIQEYGNYGQELWVTDGTEEGTHITKDIYVESGSSGFSNGGASHVLIPFAEGKVIFQCNTIEYGKENYVSDGTEEGTFLLKDINPNQGNGVGNVLEHANGICYFHGNDGSGISVWRTNGTTDGTYKVPGCPLFNINSAMLGDYLYFVYNDRIWRTNGSTTQELPELPYIYGRETSIGQLKEYNGAIYFGKDNAILCKASGTSISTVYNFGTFCDEVQIVGEVDNKLIFTAEAGSSVEIDMGLMFYFTTGSGATLISDASSGDFGRPAWKYSSLAPGVEMNGELYMRAKLNDDAFDGLCKTNGSNSMELVKQTNYYISADNKLPEINSTGSHTFFIKAKKAAYAKGESELKTLYSVAKEDTFPTVLLSGVWFSPIILLENNKVLIALDDKTYVSDGTVSGTRLLSGVSFRLPSNPSILQHDGKTYFSASNGNGYQPWVSDGTASGTHQIKTVSPGSYTEVPYEYCVFNDQVYFVFYNSSDRRYKIWKTDGTSSQTSFVQEIGSSRQVHLSATSSYLYIAYNQYLYKSDGSSASPSLMLTAPYNKEIIDIATNDTIILFYTKDYGVYYSNGTSSGTERIVGGRAYNNDQIEILGTLNDLWYFIFDEHLYVTDGTMAGTERLVTDAYHARVEGNGIVIGTGAKYYNDSTIVQLANFSDYVDYTNTDGAYVSKTGDIIQSLRTDAYGSELYIAKRNKARMSLNKIYHSKNLAHIQNGQTLDTLRNIEAPSHTHRLGDSDAQPRRGMEEIYNEYVISNGGGEPLNIESIKISGTYAEHFRIEDIPTTVAPNANESFFIYFTNCTIDGYLYANVEIKTNHPTEPVFNYLVKADNNYNASLAIKDTDDYPNNTISSFAFEETPIGGSSTNTVYLYNAGYAPLYIDSIVVTGEDKEDFSILQAPILNYNSGYYKSYQPLEIEFYPSASFKQNAEILIYHNIDTFTLDVPNPVVFKVSGSGLCTELPTISPMGISVICTGSTETKTFSIPVQENAEYCWGKADIWEHLGDEDFVRNDMVALTLKGDTPVVAVRNANTYKLDVYQLKNNVWTVIGESLSNGTVYYPSVAAAPNGDIFVAYSDYSSSKKIEVKKYDGENWTLVGTEGFSEDDAEYINIAVSKNNTVYVAYSDIGNYSRLAVKSFNGVSWENVGDMAYTGSSAHNVDLKIHNDSLFVNIADGSALSGGLTCYTWDGTNWAALGEKGYTNEKVSEAKFDISASGVPYVAYNTSLYEVSVMKYVNSEWVYVNQPKFENFYSFDFAVRGEIPYLFGRRVNNTLGYYVEFLKLAGDEWVPKNTGYTETELKNRGLDFSLISKGDSLYCLYSGGISNTYTANVHAILPDGICHSDTETLTTTTPGIYTVQVRNTVTGCEYSAANEVTLLNTDCVSNLEVKGYNANVLIPNGDVSPIWTDSTDLQTTYINQTKIVNYYIINTGFSELQISDINLSGDGLEYCNILSDTTATVQELDTFVFKIAFMPLDAISLNATVSILSNAPETPEYTYKIKAAVTCSDQITDQIKSCEPYTWSNGITYTKSTYGISQRLKNQRGCDSTVYLYYTRLEPYECMEDGDCDFDLVINQASNVLSVNETHANFRWFWLDDENNLNEITDETEASFTCWHTGRYVVEATKFNCTDTSEVYNLIVTNSREDKTNNLYMYPNPTKGQITIELPDMEENATLSVFNLSGRLIDQVQISNTNKIQYQLKGEPGMYLLQIRSKSYKSVMRIIKE